MENHQHIRSLWRGTIAAVIVRLFWIAGILMGGRYSFAAASDDICDATRTSSEPDGKKTRVMVVSFHTDSVEMRPIEQSILAQLADLEVDIHFVNMDSGYQDATSRDNLALEQMVHCNVHAVFIISPQDDPSIRILMDREGTIESSSRLVDVDVGVPLNEAFAIIVRGATIAIIEQMKQRETEEAMAALERDRALASQNSVDEADLSASRQTRESIHSGVHPNLRRFHMALGLAIMPFARGGGPSPGMHMGMGWNLTRYWQIMTGVVLFSRVSNSVQGTTLRLTRYPVYLGAGYFRGRKRFLFGGRVAFQMDFIKEQFSSENDEMSTVSDNSEASASLLFQVGGRFIITPSLSVYFNAGAAVLLKRTHYGIERNGVNTIVIETLPIQPVSSLGILVHFY